jgi:hypothetical protein
MSNVVILGVELYPEVAVAQIEFPVKGAAVGILRFDSHGGVPLSEVTTLLGSLHRAYDGHLDLIRELGKLDLDPEMHAEIRHIFGPLDQELILAAVRLESPGFWVMLGNMFGLVGINNFLAGRHERKKDIAYRNREEERGLKAKNDIIEVKALEAYVKVLRKVGLNQDQIQDLVARHILRPLHDIRHVQDSGLIENTIVSPVEDDNAA